MVQLRNSRKTNIRDSRNVAPRVDSVATSQEEPKEGGDWRANRGLSQSSVSSTSRKPIPHTNHLHRASPTKFTHGLLNGGSSVRIHLLSEAQPQPRGWIAMGTWPHHRDGPVTAEREALFAFCLLPFGNMVGVDHGLVTRDSAPLFPWTTSYQPYCGLPPRAGMVSGWCWWAHLASGFPGYIGKQSV